MRCPFLREAQVKFCRASAFKKMIVRTADHTGDERCSSPEWVSCPVAKHHHEDWPDQSHCPFLQESLVQYCTAAPMSKFVPYTEAQLSRCGNEAHRYCEAFLTLAQPPVSQPSVPATIASMDEGWVDGIQVPENLAYAPNHLWLDVGTDGTCHIGIDAFFAKVLGHIDRLSFVTWKGIARPTAVLTVRGIDLNLAFPNPISITGVNAYLRSHPEKIISEPYGAGWLFEGTQAKGLSEHENRGIEAGLIRGKQAREWIAQESRRFASFVHEEVAHTQGEGFVLMADGGTPSSDLLQYLTREEALQLFNEFFSPHANWRLSS